MTDRSDIPRNLRWILDEPIEDVLEHCHPTARELIELLGLEAALRFLADYRGMQLYVPIPDEAFKQLRNKRIRADHRAGRDLVAIAHRWNVAVDTVRSIIRQGRSSAPDQQDLFGEATNA